MLNTKHQKELENLFPDNRNSCNLSPLRRVQIIQLRILKIIDYICIKHDITYWLDGGTLLGAVRHHGFIPWDDDIDIVMPRKCYEKFISISKSELPEDMELILAGTSNRYFTPCKVMDKFSVIIESANGSSSDIGKGIFIDITPLDYFDSSYWGYFVDMLLKNINKRLLKIFNAGNDNDTYRIYFFANKFLNSLQPILSAETPLKIFRALFNNALSLRKRREEDGKEKIGYGFEVYWIRVFYLADIYPLKKIEFENYHFYAPNNTNSILKVFYGANYMSIPEIKKRKCRHIKRVIIDSKASKNEENIEYYD